MRRRVVVATLAISLAVAALATTGGSSVAALPPSGPPVIAAVGDIACKNPPGNNRSVCRYDDVAAAVRAGDYDAFLALGDIQYE